MEVSKLAKQTNKTKAGSNINEIKQQNAQSAQGNLDTEFGSETDVQSVKKQIQKAEANKMKNSSQK